MKSDWVDCLAIDHIHRHAHTQCSHQFWYEKFQKDNWFFDSAHSDKKKLKIIMQKQYYWLPSTTATTNKTNWDGDTLEILCICSYSGQTALAPYVFSTILLYIHTYILFSYITYYCRCRLFVSLSRRFLRIFFMSNTKKN